MAQTTTETLEYFCCRLRDLRQASGMPSLAVLRRSMPTQPGQATLSDLLNGKGKRAPRWDLVAELVGACKSYADRHGRQLPTELSSLTEWRRRHDDLTKVMEAVRRVSQPIRCRAQVPNVFARPIAEWNPADLGIKKAIKGDHGISDDNTSVLPLYISRPCDDEIRAVLCQCARPTFVVVVGESGAGKTRACLEGIRESAPNKPVIFPADPEELSWLLAEGYNLDEHIVWLDEAQTYLDGEESARLANLLMRLMISSTHSVIIIGTMWPKYWRDLTTRPPADQPDHSARVRRLLSLSSVRKVDVDASFSAVPQDLIDRLTLLDRRLAIAVKSCGPRLNISQVLAGGVQLLDRYQNSLNTYERTLITVSMDFRRVGFFSPATRNLLEESMEGYLSAEHRVVASEWISSALQGATYEVNGIRALEPVRAQPGLGPADSYVLHDYLDGYAQLKRRRLPIPGSAWRSLNVHAVNADDRIRISWEATFRHYNRLAVEFLNSVVIADYSAEGGLRLVWAIERAGHTEEAMEVLRRAADAGETSAMRELARRLERSGDYEGAVTWLRRAAELHDTDAMLRLGSRPFVLATWQESDFWLRRAADLGDIWAMRKLGYQDISFDQNSALHWFRCGAETGEGNLMLDLIKALHENSRKQESADWVKRLGESGHLHMIGPLAEWLEQQGRDAEAEAWLRRYADLGDMTACWNLSDLLECAGRNHEAVTVWRKAIESFALGSMSTFAARRVADQIVRADEATDAIKWLRRAADDGSPYAIPILIELTDIPDAEDLLRRSITLGNSYSTPALVDILERQGRAAEAESFLRLELENLEYPNAADTLKKLLVRQGRAEEADAFQKFGIEPGGRTSNPW